MNKNKLTMAHAALFLVAIVSVGISATRYIQAEMEFRRDSAQLLTGPPSEMGGQPGSGVKPGGGRGMRGGGDPQQMATRRLEQMSQQLKLSATQKAQIKAMQDKDIPRIKAIFDDKSIPDDQKRAKMRPLREVTNAAIQKLLTPAQQTQFAAQQAAAHAQWGGGRGGR